jgi:hypothetical protein
LVHLLCEKVCQILLGEDQCATIAGASQLEMLRLPARFRSLGTVCCATLAAIVLLYKIFYPSTWPAGFAAVDRGQDEKAALRQLYRILRDDPASESSTNASRRASAVFVILARNEDLSGMLDTLKSIEERFNRRYQQVPPYVPPISKLMPYVVILMSS